MQIIVETYNSGSPTPEFNNAGQVFNHDFYWESISPSPSASIASLTCMSSCTFLLLPLMRIHRRHEVAHRLSCRLVMWVVLLFIKSRDGRYLQCRNTLIIQRGNPSFRLALALSVIGTLSLGWNPPLSALADANELCIHAQPSPQRS